jgi:hypothetical protein
VVNPNTIEVIVARDGSSRIETHGYTGPRCQEASRFLEQALGLAESRRLTADYYRAEASEPQQQRAGQ